MSAIMRDVDDWKITALLQNGLWTVTASSWLDDEIAEGPSLDIALGRMADMIRIDPHQLLAAFGLL